MVKPQDDVQALSKRTFNSTHRLTIVASMWRERDRVHTRDSVMASSGAPGTAVHGELQLLSELGLLLRVELDGRVHYQVIDGPFWLWAEQLFERAAHRS